MSLFLCCSHLKPISDKHTSLIQCVKFLLHPTTGGKQTNSNNDASCILSALEADLHTSVRNNLKFHLNSRELLIMPEHAISASPTYRLIDQVADGGWGSLAAPPLLGTAAGAAFVCLRMDGMMQGESFVEPRHLLGPADIYSLSANPKGDEHTPR